MQGNWDQYELVAVHDRAARQGVLLLQTDSPLYLVQYHLAPLAASSTTGRARSIICDFCSTWQRGSNAGSITLSNRTTKRNVRFLCCGDLRCSEHVRSKTEASRISRTQLRENLDDGGRVSRLKGSLEQKIADLELKPISSSGNLVE